ncbi:MAG: TerD family protein [Chitinophagales bacterium]
MAINFDPRQKKKKQINFCGINIEESNAEINFDIEVSVVLLDDKGKLIDCVFYNNTNSIDNSICYELENENDSYDFCIRINLDVIDKAVKFIYFFINPCAEGYACKPLDFFTGCRVYLTLWDTSKNEIVYDKYRFDDVFKNNTSMCLIGLRQNNQDWDIERSGESCKGNLKEIIEFYNKETI